VLAGRSVLALRMHAVQPALQCRGKELTSTEEQDEEELQHVRTIIEDEEEIIDPGWRAGRA
jgi:hypothetical protein